MTVIYGRIPRAAIHAMGRSPAVLAVVALMSVGQTVRGQDAYKIVVNSANPVASVSKAQLAIYFLQQATWDDGRTVAAVDLPVASPVREAFSRDLLGMPVSAVSARWKQTSSVGQGDAPPAMATDREVLAYVRLKPGAIGYVSPGADTQGVKVIAAGKTDFAASQEVVEVGGAIPMPERIAAVRPEYPLIAKGGHIEGDVDIEIVIGATGNVEKTRVMRSVPQLDAAAIAAVRQWKYRPTMVNGVAVAVRTRIRVSFGL